MDILLQKLGAMIFTAGLAISSFFGFNPDTQTEELGRAVNPVGGKTYTLSGGGIDSDDTSITLSSFKIPVSDTAFTMSNFGDGVNAKGYVTIEPGSATRQEFVSFTGITQNSDGTAVLTGVTRGLMPVSPYTASATYAKSHSGGSIVVISNPPQLYEAIYSYIDNATTSGAVDGTVAAKGIYETATGVEAANTTAIGGGNTTATLVLTTLISTSTGGTAYTVPVTSSNGKLDGSFCCSGTTTFTGVTVGGQGIQRQYTTAGTTTWNKPDRLDYVIVELWGGGGSGGQKANPGIATGGGGGGYVNVRIASTSLPSSLTLTVGAGGTAAVSGVGSEGGTTTFGNLAAAYGGGPGSSGVDSGNYFGGGGGSAFSAGANGTPGYPDGGTPSTTLTLVGLLSSRYGGGAGAGGLGGAGVGAGGYSVCGGAGGGAVRNGGSATAGGTSYCGGNGGTGGATGTAGTAPGGGGGAAFTGSSGAGGAGKIRVTEFYY